MDILLNGMQLLDEFGNFNEDTTKKLLSYEEDNLCTVLSIIGPQNCGKSYLMNSVFGTKFGVMPPEEGFGRTTRGIWTARRDDPSMIIMDVEGFDSNSVTEEQVEEVQKFDRQTALFSLTVSNIMILNMKRDDLGKRQAGGVPLLELVFQEIVKMNSDETKHETKVIVAVRDVELTGDAQIDVLRKKVIDQVEKIWQRINPDVIFSKYIEVFVEAFPFHVITEKFRQKCANLKKKFGDNGEFTQIIKHRYSVREFIYFASNVWETIRSNQNLDVPKQKEMLSLFMCNKIMEDMIKSIEENSELNFLMAMKDETLPDIFGGELMQFIDHTLKEYDTKTKNYQNGSYKEDIKKQLKDILLQRLFEKCKGILDKRFKILISYNKEHILYFLYDGAIDNQAVLGEAISKYLDVFNRSTKGLIHVYPQLIAEIREKNQESLKQSLEKEMPAIKVVKSRKMCHAIKRQIFGSITQRKNYQSLKDMDENASLRRFAWELKELLHCVLQAYDKESSEYNASERKHKRVELEKETLMLPALRDKYNRVIDTRFKNLISRNEEHALFLLYEGAYINHNVLNDVVIKYLNAFDSSTQGLINVYPQLIADIRQKHEENLKHCLAMEMPAIKVAKSRKMCQSIKNEIFSSVTKRQDYTSLKDMSVNECPRTFASELYELLQHIFKEYDQNASKYDKSELEEKREELRKEIVLLEKLKERCRLILEEKQRLLFQENLKNIEDDRPKFVADSRKSDDALAKYINMFGEFTRDLPFEYIDIIVEVLEKFRKQIIDHLSQPRHKWKQAVFWTGAVFYTGATAVSAGVLILSGGLALPFVVGATTLAVVGAASSVIGVSGQVMMTTTKDSLRDQNISGGDQQLNAKTRAGIDALTREEINERADEIYGLITSEGNICTDGNKFVDPLAYSLQDPEMNVNIGYPSAAAQEILTDELTERIEYITRLIEANEKKITSETQFVLIEIAQCDTSAVCDHE